MRVSILPKKILTFNKSGVCPNAKLHLCVEGLFIPLFWSINLANQDICQFSNNFVVNISCIDFGNRAQFVLQVHVIGNNNLWNEFLDEK